MTMVLALLLSIFRFTGYFTEPRLGSEEIHAVRGERSRVEERFSKNAARIAARVRPPRTKALWSCGHVA